MNLQPLSIIPPYDAPHVTLPYLIAGPCSAETEEQLLTTARALAAGGVPMLRAGIWKPRTRPGNFEGVGAQGLAWLQRVQRELGMKVMVEVGCASHARQALEAGIDALWIGARTTSSPFAMQEIADALRGSDVPVFVKNPAGPDLDLWIGALERLDRAGVSHLAAVHRGFTIGRASLYRNAPEWHIPVELRRRLPGLPLICDPSHISGRRDLVATISQHAVDLGFDGLMIEAHCRPDEAWSDAAQQVTPDALVALLAGLVPRSSAPAAPLFTDDRQRMDAIDESLVELLAQRMALSRQMGELKRSHDLMVLQPERYDAILSTLTASASAKGLDPTFLRKLFELIHAESIAQQL